MSKTSQHAKNNHLNPLTHLVDKLENDFSDTEAYPSIPVSVKDVHLRQGSLQTKLSRYLKQPKNAVFVISVILLIFAFSLYVSRQILLKYQKDPKKQSEAHKFIISHKANCLSIFASSIAAFGFAIAYCLSRK